MRQFARFGYATLHIDLPGCGDSEGEFKDADWEGWLDSLRTGYDWLRTQVDGPIVVWGLRLGGALAVDLSSQLPGTAGLLLWQPITNGEVFLNQFLRIKLAAEMLADTKSQIGLKQMREQLSKGEPVEVGGYMLSPRLAARIDALRLAHMRVAVPTHWFELSSVGDGELSPASSRVIEAWVSKGGGVSSQVLSSDAFWATQEITECPALIPATSRALSELLK
jgi:exosortase A-associated hydrolase 2